ncbi:MAG: hypothetical protein AABX29_03040 [Nanoarchaeota archaeon]
MKDELVIKKNKLDLKHQALLQKLNAIYVGTFAGIISFVATWVFQPSYQETGMAITLALIIIFTGMLNKTQKEIKRNLEELDKIIL